MRISSNTQFIASNYSLNSNQARLASLNEQLSSLKRINRPSDDPVASAQLINLGQSMSRNDQMMINTRTIESTLALSEEYLFRGGEVLQSIQNLAIQAGNASLTDEDRSYLRTQLQEQVKGLVGIANSADGQGKYLFSGTKSDTPPFELTLEPTMSIQYKGDWQRQDVAASASRDIAITEPGGLLFGASSSVADPNKPDEFSAGNELWQALARFDQILADGPKGMAKPGPDGETVMDNATPPAAVLGADGKPLQFKDGLPRLDANGAALLEPVLDAGGNPVLGPDGVTPLQQAQTKDLPPTYDESLAKTIEGLKDGHEQLLRSHTSIGARRAEVETLSKTGEGLDVQYKAAVGQLQDLDYVQAITDLNMAITAMDTTQKTYKLVSELSLFKYI
ncbi:flagellar hook-associated protein FlgL [Craterilacuibacter sinensis]|uniref:Flagellar hook-associated protein 3 n=1 Tax=Craterilacuibacter sinensis TaxID=2686017 RepID=A0A845BRI3_9NEIS|nr:flagellar hook-associated protein FlgL [Craterilacuibacter sinensis]MXR36826.1 flagellar hook-associated protein 3 [Craterilacuibacter sinensis]